MVLLAWMMYTTGLDPALLYAERRSFRFLYPSSDPVVLMTSPCLPLAMKVLTMAQYFLVVKCHAGHLAHPAIGINNFSPCTYRAFVQVACWETLHRSTSWR